MNWKRGFKRITHVVAIVIAVACGVIAVYLPIHQHRYALANWWGNNDPLVIKQPTEKDLADFEKWQQDNKVIIDPNSYCIIPDSTNDQTLMTVCNNYFKSQREAFWYNLPTAKLIGMVVLCGLGGVVAGYVGTWAILWYGGLAIVVLIHWLILGFREDKPKDKQNNN